MNDADSRQVALQNLREFQEMSYFDVYALIRQKRFAEAKAKYAAVLENMGVADFSAASEVHITTPHDVLLDCMSQMAGSVSEPEKIRAVGFDLSSHIIFHDDNGQLNQGIEVSLYSEDIFDFANSSDEKLTMQCESSASEWQGNFIEISSVGLNGLGPIVQQFQTHAQNLHNLQGIIQNENGTAIVDPVAIAKHVAKLLVAIEYHRYMASFVEEVEVPSQMVFIIGEHDEIEVPIVFYRVGEPQAKPAVQVETLVQAAVMQEALPEVETPSMYHPADEQNEQAEETDQSIDHQQLDLDEDILNVAVLPETAEEIASANAKALLGRSIEPKTFGQRSNKVLTGEEEDGEDTQDDEQNSA